MEWLTQGVISSVIASLLVAGGGILIAYFRHKGSQWVIPVLHGLGASGLILAIIVGILAVQAIPPAKPRVTPDNLEGYIKQWAEINGLGITKPQNQVPDSFFSYVLTLKNGTPISVFRLKGNSRRLDLHCVIALTEENQKRFAALSKDETENFVQEISRQLGLVKIGNFILSSAPFTATPGNVIQPFGPQLSVEIFKSSFISGMDEDEFVRDIDEIDSASSVVKAIMITGLKPKKVSRL